MTFLGLNSRVVTVKKHIYSHPKFNPILSLCHMMAENVAKVMLGTKCWGQNVGDNFRMLTKFRCWCPEPPYKDRKLVA